MNDLDLLIDWHRDGPRQGPGGDGQTRLALALSSLDRTRALQVADIGCGTGASAQVLANELDADIYAVDLSTVFLNQLRRKADVDPHRLRIFPMAASMELLPFAPQSLDLIWSEGAIYNMGFGAGVSAWRQLLKPGGHLIVSEIAWLAESRPPELEVFWNDAYPEMATMAEKVAILERRGFELEACFTLPGQCWVDNYYAPMASRRDAFLARHRHSDAAKAIVEAELEEARLYERYCAWYGYGMFIARRADDIGS